MRNVVTQAARPLSLLCGLLLVAACSGASGAPQAAASPAGGGGAWRSLMDLSQWRGFKRQDVPSAWRIQDGAIAFAPSTAQGARGDLITRDQFGDFELEYEWRISEGGNSGVIYRSTEDESTPWRTGPEMQVLDNERHSDGKLPSHRAGALYDLLVPGDNIARPVGEWNQARVMVRGNHIQQWLNGHKTADIVVGSPEWQKVYAASKFKDLAGFARQPRGHIVLQDHGDPVWFRNVRVRSLDAGR